MDFAGILMLEHQRGIAQDLLLHPELGGLVESGRITTGMIRPQAYENSKGLSDDELAQAVLGWIDSQTPFEVFGALPMAFTAPVLERMWYDKEDQLRAIEAVRHPEQYADRWEELIGLMSSGASTFVLMHGPADTCAPELFTTIKGTYAPEPGTLRRTFGVGAEPYNTLFHSPHTIGQVQHELSVVRAQLFSA